MNSLSSSQRATWLECRLRWEYEYVIKPDVTRYESRDLMRGSAGHAAMEAYYAAEPAGRSLEALIANAEQYLMELAESKELNEGEEADVVKAHDEVCAALRHWWGMFGPDNTYPVVETELRLERPFGWRDEYSFHGILDGVVRLNDRVVILENKFPLYAPQPSQYITWSPQHRDYAWLLGVDKPVYVVYNVISTTKAVRYGPLLVPKWQQDEALSVNTLVIEEMQEYSIYPHYGFHCQRCPFKTLCEERLIGGDA